MQVLLICEVQQPVTYSIISLHWMIDMNKDHKLWDFRTITRKTGANNMRSYVYDCSSCTGYVCDFLVT